MARSSRTADIRLPFRSASQSASGHGQRAVRDASLAGRVVDQDVDAAQMRQGRGRQFPGPVRAGDVGGDEVAGAVVVAVLEQPGAERERPLM
jgi:hypothetical protein